MTTLVLCYFTKRGASAVNFLYDAEATEKALRALCKLHIEADLYVLSAYDEKDNRSERVGGVDNTPGTLWNGRTVEWCWWFDPDVFKEHRDE